MNLPNKPFKLFRLVLCLVIILGASSLFLTVEPVASESTESLLPMPEQEVLPVITLRARTPNIPMTPLHAKRQSVNLPKTVISDDIETSLSVLSAAAVSEPEEPEELIDEPEEPTPEPEPEPSSNNASSSEQNSNTSSNESTDDSSEDDSWQEEEQLPPPAVQSPKPSEGTYSDIEYLAAICQIEAG